MKVGDYVRTKRGLIAKIININEFREPCMKYGIEASYLDDIWFIGDDDIKLVKEKPIDLIEIGDYVNGCLVSEIKDKWLILNYADIETYEQLERKNENIKSIVTKEQFESIQYNLESEVN